METKGREQSSNVIDKRPKTISDIIDQESFPNKTQSSQFLIDTFKRARETGYSLPPEVFNAMKPFDGDPWMFAANTIGVDIGTWGISKQAPSAYATQTFTPDEVQSMKPSTNDNKRIRVVK